MKKRKDGFTFAEVLIALTIIGVVSALTIPTLVQKTNKQEYVSALQKAYSVLSQATQQIIAENGSPKADENGETWMKDTPALFEMYKKYLVGVKECKGEAGCRDFDIKRLDGTVYLKKEIDQGAYRLITADGMIISFENWSKTCSNSKYYGNKNVCAQIYVHVNGAKGPNVMGRDFFDFSLKENGLFPSGCDDLSYCGTKDNSMGYGCTCRVLKEGAINY